MPRHRSGRVRRAPPLAWRARGAATSLYVNHLAEVANLLAVATSGADAELVAAGWLHDTIEDTETTREELAEEVRRTRRGYRGRG